MEQPWAILALARAGETARAEKLTADLDKAHPLGTTVQQYWLPTIRAAVALHRKEPKRAIELLKTANAIALTDEGDLHPAYLRGEAYLMLQDGNAAAADRTLPLLPDAAVVVPPTPHCRYQPRLFAETRGENLLL